MKDPGAVPCISGLVLWWQQVEEWSQSLYRVLGGFPCRSPTLQVDSLSFEPPGKHAYWSRGA